MTPSPDQPAVPPASAAANRTARLATVVAAAAVAAAVKVDGGNYHPAAVALLVVAVTAGLIAVAGLRVRALEAAGGRAVGWAVAVVIAGSAVLLSVGRLVPPSTSGGPSADAAGAPMHALLTACGFSPPTDVPASPAAAYALLLAGVALGAAAVWAAAQPAADPAKEPSAAGRTLWHLAMPAALVLHLAGLVAAVRAAPAPVMDVLVFQAASAAHLMAGDDPYAVRFPDLSGGTSPHYGPGLQADGELLFGFPYPPLSLYWLLPVWLAGGAVQYAHAVGFTVAAGLIAYARRGPLAKAAAVLFMANPTGPLVVCYGWTETLVAPMLALTVFVACRRNGSTASETGGSDATGSDLAGLPKPRPWWLGAALGLWWAAKQYVPLTAPLAWLLVARRSEPVQRWRPLVVAVGTGALVTLPLVLWDPAAFWHSAVAVQFRQPFRPDALSFAALWFDRTGSTPPTWLAFVALGVVQGLALCRSPRTPAGFAAAVGTALLVFFAFNKQAFAGYYFLVAAAYACALAASGGSPGVGQLVGPASPVGPPAGKRRRRRSASHAGV